MNGSWKKTGQKRYKAGYRKMIRRTFELPSGETADYDIVESGPAVCVLALTEAQKVILIRIYRPGPEKLLTELPGGFIDEGLTPEEAIKKELLEETGYSGKFTLAGTSYEDAYSTMFRYHFVATDCKLVQEPKREFDEIGAKTVLVEVGEFRDHLKRGELTDPETGYIGLTELGLL